MMEPGSTKRARVEDDSEAAGEKEQEVEGITRAAVYDSEVPMILRE